MAMPPKRPRDVNQLAKLMVDIASGEEVDAAETVLQQSGHDVRARLPEISTKNHSGQKKVR